MSGYYDPYMFLKASYITEYGTKMLFNELQNVITWNKNEVILDMGCGNGETTNNVLSRFAPPDAKIIAMDMSTEMISYAKFYFSDPNITYMVADITDDLHLTMKKELFTKIVSFFTLYRIENNRKVYQNMHYLLKPGGEILLTIPCDHDMDLIPSLLAKLPKYSKYSEQLSKMKINVSVSVDHKAYTERLLGECGFEIAASVLKKITFTMDSVDSNVELFGFVSRLKNVLPKEMFDEALRDAADVIKINNLMENDGDKYIVNFDCLFISARKK